MSDAWIGRLVGAGVTLLIVLVIWLMFAPCLHAECLGGWREVKAAHGDRVDPKFSHHIKGHRGEKCWYAQGWKDREWISDPMPTPSTPATAYARASSALAAARMDASPPGETGVSTATLSASTASADDSKRSLQDTLTPADRAISPVPFAHAAFSGQPSVDLTQPYAAVSVPESFVLAVWKRWLRGVGERLQVRLSSFQGSPPESR